jgi:hypothetical protein
MIFCRARRLVFALALSGCFLPIFVVSLPAYARADAPDVSGDTLTQAQQILSDWANQNEETLVLMYPGWDVNAHDFIERQAWGSQVPAGVNTDLFTVEGDSTTETDGPNGHELQALLGLTVRVPALIGDSLDAAGSAGRSADFAIALPDGEQGEVITGQSPDPGTVVGVTGDPVGTIHVTVGSVASSPSTSGDAGGQQPSGGGNESQNGGFGSDLLSRMRPQLVIGILIIVFLLIVLSIVRGGRRRRSRRSVAVALAGPPTALVASAPRQQRGSRHRPRVITVRRRDLPPTYTIEDR